MTTRKRISALRNECDDFAEQTLQCKGEFHPDFHKIADERFYNIAFEAGRQAEREACAKVCENNLNFWKGTSSANQDYRDAHEKDLNEIRARSTK